MRPAYLRFGGTEGDNLQYVMGDATAEAGPAYPQPANTMNSTDLKLLFDYFAVDAGGLPRRPCRAVPAVPCRSSLSPSLVAPF